LKANLVNGFNVNQRSPMLDCVACTEAKQHIEPFLKTMERQTQPGELTHINLWKNMPSDLLIAINIISYLWTMQSAT
jgi:hypothetical protein